MPSILDPEVEILATYSQVLQSDYEESDDASWRGSPFNWIRARPSRQRGTIGEKMVAGYLACKGFDVTRSPDTEADRIVAGCRAEIKMSTLWKSGLYKFQQLRDQDYKFAVCLGISPFDAHCWVLPKREIIERWRVGDIPSQHGGAEGNDTAWLSVNPSEAPEWLHEWGGRLSDAVRLVAEITEQEPLM